MSAKALISFYSTNPTSMINLLDLSDDVLYLIAKHAVEEDLGDRMWAILTRLLRSQRGLLPWQRAIRDMNRPVIFWVRLKHTLARGTRVLELNWTAKTAKPRHITFSIRGRNFLRVRAITTTDDTTRCSLRVKDLLADGGLCSDGRYLVHLTWDRDLAISGLSFDFSLFEHARMAIVSFGNQNLTSLESTGLRESRVHWPPLLPPTVRSLRCFAYLAYSFDCKNIQYWDVRNVTDMESFMRNTEEFSGDLSRLAIQPNCKTTGAFYHTGAIALPNGFVERARPRLFWERVELRFPTLWMRLPRYAMVLYIACLIASLCVVARIGAWELIISLWMSMPVLANAIQIWGTSRKVRICCVNERISGW